MGMGWHGVAWGGAPWGASRSAMHTPDDEEEEEEEAEAFVDGGTEIVTDLLALPAESAPFAATARSAFVPDGNFILQWTLSNFPSDFLFESLLQSWRRQE